MKSKNMANLKKQKTSNGIPTTAKNGKGRNTSKHEPSHRIRYLEYYSESDLINILHYASADGPLTYALFHFFIMTGVRLREALHLTIDDLYFGKDVIRLRNPFFPGYRTVPFIDKSVVNQYLSIRKDITSKRNQNVFLHHGEALTARFIAKLCARIERKSGIRISTHRIRRSIALHLYWNGANVMAISAILDSKRQRRLYPAVQFSDETLCACTKKHHPLSDKLNR